MGGGQGKSGMFSLGSIHRVERERRTSSSRNVRIDESSLQWYSLLQPPQKLHLRFPHLVIANFTFNYSSSSRHVSCASALEVIYKVDGLLVWVQK